jgi:hypothetical protein
MRVVFECAQRSTLHRYGVCSRVHVSTYDELPTTRSLNVFQSYHLAPDAVDPADVEHSEIFMPVQRPPHDPRKQMLLSDAYVEIDRISRDEEGLRDDARYPQLMAAFEKALIFDVITGGFLSALGFARCDGVELAGMGTDHARLGPYIADWWQGPHRQGAYVVDAKQFAEFLQDNPLASGLETIVVHPSAPPVVRFLAGEGHRIAQSMKPCSQKSLTYALQAAFTKRHPDVAINEKAFAMWAAGYLT